MDPTSSGRATAGGDPQVRVLVVEDDEDVAAYVEAALRRGLRAHVTAVVSPAAALALVGAEDWDALVTDIELPRMSGLELVQRVREVVDDLPVVVVSGHATFDNAVAAMRAGAAEFLAKPVAPRLLTGTVERLVRERRAQHAARSIAVLAVGAHPDDVELGIGATLARHHAAGDVVTILTLSGGEVGGCSQQRIAEAGAAARVLGAGLRLEGLRDTTIGEGNPTVGLIEAAVREARPDVVYVHAAEDTHQDHRAVQRATLVATRGVGTVLGYQSPSATVAFRPHRFVDVTDHLTRKLAAMDCHESQRHQAYFDPELVTATARYWGRFASVRYAEPLEVVRDVTLDRVTVPGLQALDATALGERTPDAAAPVETAPAEQPPRAEVGSGDRSVLA